MLCSRRDPRDLCLSFVPVWSLLHTLSKILAKRWAAMATKRKEGDRGSSERNARKKCWRTPSRSMEGRNEHVNYVPCLMCGRGGAAGDVTTTPRPLRGECRQAISARTSEWSTGPSSSSEGEERRRFGPRLSSFEGSREERQDKKDKVSQQEEGVVLRKTGTSLLRRRSRT